jgi:carbonic anhydrase
MTADPRAIPTPDAELQLLLEGNRRYVEERHHRPRQSAARRLEVKNGQEPFALIFGCADSRVPPEVIFDMGLGDLLVVRVAGNVLGDAVLGTIEFGADHLQIPLVMVLVHSQCGAVKSALAGGDPPGRQRLLHDLLQPSIAAARHLPGDLVDNVVREHGRRVAAELKGSPEVLAPRIASGKLKIVPAYYDLDSGQVELLT